MPSRQAARQLAYRDRCVLDRADMPYLTATPSICHSDGDCGLVHVKADEGANFPHSYISQLAGPTPRTGPGCGLARLKGHAIWLDATYLKQR